MLNNDQKRSIHPTGDLILDLYPDISASAVTSFAIKRNWRCSAVFISQLKRPQPEFMVVFRCRRGQTALLSGATCKWAASREAQRQGGDDGCLWCCGFRPASVKGEAVSSRLAVPSCTAVNLTGSKSNRRSIFCEFEAGGIMVTCLMG